MLGVHSVFASLRSHRGFLISLMASPPLEEADEEREAWIQVYPATARSIEAAKARLCA